MDTFIANGQILVMPIWQKKQHSTQALGIKKLTAKYNALAKLFSTLNLGLFACRKHVHWINSCPTEGFSGKYVQWLYWTASYHNRYDYWLNSTRNERQKMNIQPFGEINPAELEEFYDGEIEVNGRLIEIDLNFEEESIEAEELTKVESFVKNIETHMKQAFDAISADYDLGEESDTALFYLEHHQKELSEANLTSIFGTTQITKELFLNKLSANRIGLYPEEEEAFAIIDIQLPEEFTNYLMAVTFDNNGKFAFISMDS